jgi:hypothetical protein
MGGNQVDRAGRRGITLRGIIFVPFNVLGGMEGNRMGASQARVPDLSLEIRGDPSGRNRVATRSLGRAAEMTAVVIIGIVGIHGLKREYGSEEHPQTMML